MAFKYDPRVQNGVAQTGSGKSVRYHLLPVREMPSPKCGKSCKEIVRIVKCAKGQQIFS